MVNVSNVMSFSQVLGRDAPFIIISCVSCIVSTSMRYAAIWHNLRRLRPRGRTAELMDEFARGIQKEEHSSPFAKKIADAYFTHEDERHHV